MLFLLVIPTTSARLPLANNKPIVYGSTFRRRHGFRTCQAWDEKSKNDLRWKKGRAEEWNCFIVTSQHLNECVFLGMLAPALKHERKEKSTGYDIWESQFSEWIILKWDYHQGADAKHSRSHLENALTSMYVSAPVFACDFVTALTWVLSEMHNMEEASHIVLVVGVHEVSLTFYCCELCSWRFQLPHRKVRRTLKRDSLDSLV